DQPGKQGLVALEEVRMLLEILGEALFVVGVVVRHCRCPVAVHDCGTSICPSKTWTESPARYTGFPSPAQSTSTRPPGSSTATCSPTRPSRRALTTAAQPPPPQASVSPTPRSNTRSRIVPPSTICMNPTLVRSGKRG